MPRLWGCEGTRNALLLFYFPIMLLNTSAHIGANLNIMYFDINIFPEFCFYFSNTVSRQANSFFRMAETFHQVMPVINKGKQSQPVPEKCFSFVW